MRQIKFRGKTLKEGKWIFGNLTEDVKGHYRIQFDVKSFSSVVIPETVGQFTGLTESYERTKSFEPKEIYQHDILEIEYKGKKIICFVEFEICGFILVSNDFEDGYIWITDVEEHDADDCCWISFSRIIGNIHENPSLLTDKE